MVYDENDSLFLYSGFLTAGPNQMKEHTMKLAVCCADGKDPWMCLQ